MKYARSPLPRHPVSRSTWGHIQGSARKLSWACLSVLLVLLKWSHCCWVANYGWLLLLHYSYLCEVCKKTFARASILKKHMMTHSGERPWVKLSVSLYLTVSPEVVSFMLTRWLWVATPTLSAICAKYARRRLLVHPISKSTWGHIQENDRKCSLVCLRNMLLLLKWAHFFCCWVADCG